MQNKKIGYLKVKDSPHEVLPVGGRVPLCDPKCLWRVKDHHVGRISDHLLMLSAEGNRIGL
jgi:hypothetical protein